jgi:hypothetical protein
VGRFPAATQLAACPHSVGTARSTEACGPRLSRPMALAGPRPARGGCSAQRLDHGRRHSGAEQQWSPQQRRLGVDSPPGTVAAMAHEENNGGTASRGTAVRRPARLGGDLQRRRKAGEQRPAQREGTAVQRLTRAATRATTTSGPWRRATASDRPSRNKGEAAASDRGCRGERVR